LPILALALPDEHPFLPLGLSSQGILILKEPSSSLLKNADFTRRATDFLLRTPLPEFLRRRCRLTARRTGWHGHWSRAKSGVGSGGEACQHCGG
jgi:hypothetical protein